MGRFRKRPMEEMRGIRIYPGQEEVVQFIVFALFSLDAVFAANYY